jgi:hypothetical protein
MMVIALLVSSDASPAFFSTIGETVQNLGVLLADGGTAALGNAQAKADT